MFISGMCLETVIYYEHRININANRCSKLGMALLIIKPFFTSKNKCVLYMYDLSFVFEVKIQN